METEIGVEGNEEGKFEESGVDKSSSSVSSAKQIANPVVYKLVRLEGDGRLVPATDDEVMEVEGLLLDDKNKMHIVADTRQDVLCISNEGCSSGMSQLESSEGMSHSENAEVDPCKLNSHLEYIEEMLQRVKEEERLRMACRSPDYSSAYVLIDGECSDQHFKLPDIDKKLQCEIPLEETITSVTPSLDGRNMYPFGSPGECSNPPDKLMEGEPLTSAIVTSSKPEFSKLRGEICLDSLSIKELHETFRATFGQETTVKDKQWLKRRIAMGLTGSCDVSTKTFTIRDNKLVRNSKEDSCNDVNGTPAEDHIARAMICNQSQLEDRQAVSDKRLGSYSMDNNFSSEDHSTEKRAAKRVRKPTRRYIEELSEVESKESSRRPITSAKVPGYGHLAPKSYVSCIRKISSDGKTVITRLDSLGGSGIQIPCVSRIRRSRPRKNFMAFLKFNPSDVGNAAMLVKMTIPAGSFQPDFESGNEVLKTKSASGHQLDKTENDKQVSALATVVGSEHDMELRYLDSSGNSDDNVVTIPTPKGGIRRKHHRAWTLTEVMKLVEGVSRYGAGRWSEIKRLAFASYSYRTSVDLKDKWRNLLKASFAQTPPDKVTNSRKNTASMPIPAPILSRVRELAEMQAQVPPNLSSSKVTGATANNVQEKQPGYL